jgi:heme oxygenase
MKSLEDAASQNPALLIAHSYSRYLGDLSGKFFFSFFFFFKKKTKNIKMNR